jgi:3-hydroxyacyl-CoA dehydrogenase
MSSPVTYERKENIGIITVNNPPVNALSQAVRAGLSDCLKEAINDSSAEAVIVTGGGRTFMAGADISEFGKPTMSPDLNSVIFEYEDSNKPTIAALHGTPLGGGLEVSMGCHYRVADSKTLLGLPEVKLGLLPGAGGTQRLPRLVGPELALEMITSGNPIPANKAMSEGLVSEVYENSTHEELIENAIIFAKKILSNNTHPKSRDRTEKITNISPDIFENAIKKITPRLRGRTGPLRCIEAVRGAVDLSFEEGIKNERDLFKLCHDSEESEALIHSFFSERMANKIPGMDKNTPLRPINNAVVIGCGTMGGGIAMSFVNAGIPVSIIETSSEFLEKGMNVIKNNYATTVSKGRLSQENMDKRMSLLTPTLEWDVIKDADIIIEAVFEEMGIKKEIFTKIDNLAKDGAILASNTSTLDIDEIANATKRPEEVVGTHFFSPANVMRLLEIVRGSRTKVDILATLMSLAKKIKKVGIIAGNCDGFVGNRMFHQYIMQAHLLVEEGATPEQVDSVAEKWGWAMGPFAVNDLAGNDVGWLIRKRHKAENYYEGKKYASDVADRLCELGRFGQKVGKGFYKYDPKTRRRESDPEVHKIIEDVRREKGVNPREISDDEILSRLHGALINEGTRILEEGHAFRASDIDVCYVNGYGFAAHRGGPMWQADKMGVNKVAQEINNHRNADNLSWPESKLMNDLEKSNGKLSEFIPDTSNPSKRS